MASMMLTFGKVRRHVKRQIVQHGLSPLVYLICYQLLINI